MSNRFKKLFLNYEISKALKEKGFDENCLAYFKDQANFTNEPLDCLMEIKYPQCIKAPLYQQAIEWIRESHNIEIRIFNGGSGHHWECILKHFPDGELLKVVNPPKDYNIKSYYACLEQAIIESINLIRKHEIQS